MEQIQLVVRVNGDKEYKAKLIGKDPLIGYCSSSKLFQRINLYQLILEIQIKQELEIG